MAAMSTQLFIMTLGPPAYLAPPITSLFIWGMSSSIPNKYGARFSLGIGLIFGFARFICESIELTNGYHRGDLYGKFTQLHFMYFALLQFFMCTFFLFFTSFLFGRFLIITSTLATRINQHKREMLMYRTGYYQRLMLMHSEYGALTLEILGESCGKNCFLTAQAARVLIFVLFGVIIVLWLVVLVLLQLLSV
jgi:hypothetical protein